MENNGNYGLESAFFFFTSLLTQFSIFNIMAKNKCIFISLLFHPHCRVDGLN